MPENWLAPDLHHGLWAHVGFFANSRAASAREDDYFHKCAPQTCGPVRPALSGSVARKLRYLRGAHKHASTLAPLIPKFANGRAAMGCELRNRCTSHLRACDAIPIISPAGTPSCDS